LVGDAALAVEFVDVDGESERRQPQLTRRQRKRSDPLTIDTPI